MTRTRKLTLAAGLAFFALAGNAAATQTATPASLSFPPTPVGTESAPLTITYTVDALEAYRTTNPGSPCTVEEGLAGTCPYRFTTTCPVQPAQFGTGPQTCTFTVYFKPSTPGSFPKTLAITPTTRVALNGTGTAAGGKGKSKKCKKGKKRKKGKGASAAAKGCGKKKGKK